MTRETGLTIGGTIASLVTPFNGYGGIDTDGVGRLVEHAHAGGARGVLVNAPVGEGPHLSRGERIFVVEAAVEAAVARLAVYACTGAVSTEETLALTWDAGKAGAAAAFIATPFYYPLTQAALLDHYRYLARRGRLPLVPVGDSAAVGNSLTIATLAELAAVEGIVAVALDQDDEAMPDPVMAAVGARVPVLSTRDERLLAAWQTGAAGVLSALSGLLPSEVRALRRAVAEGDTVGAEARWARLQPLAALLDHPASGVAAAKATATALGLPGGLPRSPLPGASDDLLAAINRALARVSGAEAGT